MVRASVCVSVVCGMAALPGAMPPARAAVGCMIVGTEPLPKGAQGDAARAFVAQFLDDGEDSVRVFEEQYRSGASRSVPLTERIQRMKQMRRDFGRLEVTEVLESTPASLTCIARDARDRVVLLDFVFSKTEAGRVEGVQLGVGDESIRPQLLTPPQVDEVVERVCRALEAEYVFPEVAARMAAAARERLEAGEYHQHPLETTLARRLTEDLRAVSGDKHLGVRVSARRPDSAEGAVGMGDGAAQNYGFKRVEVLPGNVGYVRFDGFFEGEGARRAASAAMQFVSGCDAVIFDLRHNGGGSPEQIRFITSYLYEEPTHLNDMVDRAGKVVEEYWTLKDVPGRRLKAGIPVYVLTSGYSFSGAEEFTYNLKNLGRATVIGETTGGGAHPVKGVRINDRFVIGVPYMRARNPISGSNWEGTGVSPDIEVAADAALDEALEHARNRLGGGAGPR